MSNIRPPLPTPGLSILLLLFGFLMLVIFFLTFSKSVSKIRITNYFLTWISTFLKFDLQCMLPNAIYFQFFSKEGSIVKLHSTTKKMDVNWLNWLNNCFRQGWRGNEPFGYIGSNPECIDFCSTQSQGQAYFWKLFLKEKKENKQTNSKIIPPTKYHSRTILREPKRGW